MNFWPKNPVAADGRRIAYLDGIRGIAIGAVLLLHWGSAYTPIGSGGHVGVTMFLVLSGYLITSILWKSRIGYGKFLRKRLIRLYPALLGVLLVTPLLAAAVPNSGVPWREARNFALIALVQGTAPWAILHFHDQHNLFIVTWSLSVEWAFYIIWAPLLLVAKRRGQAPADLARGCWIAAVILWLGSMPVPVLWAYFGPTLNSAALLVGAATALHLIHNPTAPTWWSARRATLLTVPAFTAFAAWVLLGAGTFSIVERALVIPGVCALSILLILTGRWYGGSFVAVALSTRPLVVVGRISYSLYLWHLIPLYLLTPKSLPFSRPVTGLVGIVFTAAATFLTYHFLEKPFTRSRVDSIQGRVDKNANEAQATIVELPVTSLAQHPELTKNG